MPILFADYETRSECDIKSQGADVYARHPSTSVMAFGYAFDDESPKMCEIGEPPPKEIIEHVAEGSVFVAHNAAFEWLIWNYVWRRDYPSLPPLKVSQLVCTMARSYAMGLPGSLEKSSAALGIDQEKDLKGARVMTQLAQPREIVNGKTIWWDPFEFEDKFQMMYDYCAQDVVVEREIYKRTLALSPEEKEMWELDFKINQRGVAVDLESAEAAAEIVEMEGTRLHDEMRRITGNQVATTTAHAQLTAWLRANGVQTDGVAKSDVADLLEREDLPSPVRRALEIRRDAAKSSTAKFSSLLERTGKDGRMRSTLQYHGAGTGRWAGRGFQLHNLPRPKLEQSDVDGIFGVLRGQ